MGLSGRFFFSSFGGREGRGGRGRCLHYGQYEHTARSLFLQEDRDPVPSTSAIFFFLPTIGVTPKKTSGSSPPKSLCNEVTRHLSLKGSPISARPNK